AGCVEVRVMDRDRDLERELRDHLELEAEAQRDAGRTDARYAAKRAFGNELQIREETRRMWRWTFLEQIGQAVRDAARWVRTRPGFSAVAIACLALGIGANTALFTVMNAVMLKSLPVKDPEQLVQIRYAAPRRLPRQVLGSTIASNPETFSF